MRVTKVKNGNMTDIEATLVSQSITLDAIFNDLATKSFINMQHSLKVTETYMRMALKAQAQCRCTIEALNEMKNPKSVTITKQANISEQQIVNNGTMNTDSSHAENNQNESNELLEVIEHEQVDTGTHEKQSKAIRKWKPWEQSTGAKTVKGKARSSQNALKHGFRSRQQIELRMQINELIRQSKEVLESPY